MNKPSTESSPVPPANPPILDNPKLPRKKRRWPFVVGGIILVLVVVGVYSGFALISVKNHVTSGAAHLQTALDGVKAGGNLTLDQAFFDRTQAELKAAQADFQSAHQSLGLLEPALPLLGWLPSVGYDVANLGPLLDIAEKGTQAGSLVIEGGQPALTVLADKSSGADGSARLLAASQQLGTPPAQQKFRQAYDLLGEVAARRKGLDPTRLGIEQARKAVGQLDQQLPALRDGLNLALQLPSLLPNALGQTRPVNYMVVIENSDELRPTGGFVSAVGLIALNNGKLTVQNFQDSYLLDGDLKNAPPALDPMTRYMGAEKLVLRDANWWPDFPTSARQLLDLYGQNQGVRPDGVIALDMKAVTGIFEAFGPLDLPAYNEHLTAQNFEERLHYYFLPPGTPTGDDWWLKRKEFIGVTMKALLGRLSSASAGDYLKLADQLGKAAGQKHLQFYFADQKLEQELIDRGLDGAQTQLTAMSDSFNDYLMLTEANLGFNKVNPKIDRQLAYSVSAPSAGANLFASLTITYTSRAGVREGTESDKCVKVAKYDSSYDAMINGCYWNYLRIYAPGSSQLSAATGFPADSPLQTGSENNKTVFASQVVLPPGQTRVLTLRYSLPYRWTSASHYSLTVQKQAGLLNLPLSLHFETSGQTHDRQLNLDSDQTFALYP